MISDSHHEAAEGKGEGEREGEEGEEEGFHGEQGEGFLDRYKSLRAGDFINSEIFQLYHSWAQHSC